MLPRLLGGGCETFSFWMFGLYILFCLGEGGRGVLVLEARESVGIVVGPGFGYKNLVTILKSEPR